MSTMRSKINRLSPVARGLLDELLQAPRYSMGEEDMTAGEARVAAPELERSGLVHDGTWHSAGRLILKIAAVEAAR